jgi:hypothetical protein
VFDPTLNDTAVLVATVVPLTLIVAFPWLRVGVTVVEVTVFATDAVYEVVAPVKVGESVAPESVNALRFALELAYVKALVLVAGPFVPPTHT